jgi:alpha-glucosidase
MGDTNENLIVDWMKACFLFPFSRNHTCAGTRQQEPWTFSRQALGILRHHVRLRYKLLPYLYNLFVEHERSGEAVMRPLFYDFQDTPGLALGTIDDQFMVGPSIMQAPFVTEKESRRRIVLPAGSWYRADAGTWVKGGKAIWATREREKTPLFVRDGSLVPMQKGVRTSNRSDLKSIDLHCFLSKGFKGDATTTYVCDDGLSFDYRKGTRTVCAITARVEKGVLTVDVQTKDRGFGSVDFTPVSVEPFATCVLRVDGKTKQLKRSTRNEDTFGCRASFYYWK